MSSGKVFDVIPVADYFGLPELCEKLKAVKEPVTENNNDCDIIRLNVGGTIFETTRKRMMQKPGSKLAEMFTPGSKTSPSVTADGAYFIDASPRAFEVVLNWLRHGGTGMDFPAEDFPWNDLHHAANIIGLTQSYDSGFDFL